MSEPLRNIEIKAILRDPDWVIKKCNDLTGTDGHMIVQEDYFFNVENGRLKLRFYGGQSAELIFYDRPNVQGPKLCKYEKCSVDDGMSLLNILRNILGVRGFVKKVRNLFIIGQTRVHIDRVTDLGDYLEFEVVLKENQSIEDGERIANEMMVQFNIQSDDLLCDAYVDIIQRSKNI